MALYQVLLIGLCILDIFFAFAAFYIADSKGHDPMSAFIAVMLFSLLGFILVCIMSDRIAKEQTVMAEDDKTNDTKSVVISYSKKRNEFLMLIRDNPVSLEIQKEVFKTEGVRYYLRDSKYSIKEITKPEAEKIFKLKKAA